MHYITDLGGSVEEAGGGAEEAGLGAGERVRPGREGRLKTRCHPVTHSAREPLHGGG